jgi:hypothetical protein
VALARTDVSEEPGASFIRVTKIGELGTTQAATSNRRTLRSLPSSPIFVTLMKEAPGSSETSVLARATRRNNPEDTIFPFFISQKTTLFIVTAVKTTNLTLTAITELLRTLEGKKMKRSGPQYV